MNWIESGRKPSWFILQGHFNIYLNGLRTKAERSEQPDLGRDLNPDTAYRSRDLIVHSRRSSLSCFCSSIIIDIFEQHALRGLLFGAVTNRSCTYVYEERCIKYEIKIINFYLLKDSSAIALLYRLEWRSRNYLCRGMARRLLAGPSARRSSKIPGQSMWHLWQKKWQLDMFISEYFGFSLSVSFHRCSIFIYHRSCICFSNRKRR